MREWCACFMDMLSRCGFCENIKGRRECFTGFMEMLLAGASCVTGWLDGLLGLRLLRTQLQLANSMEIQGVCEISCVVFVLVVMPPSIYSEPQAL